MANLTFNSPEEFIDAIYRASKANPWWEPEEILQELSSRWATIKWIPVWWEDWFDFKDEDMSKILAWWEPLGGWNKRDLVEWEAWYDEWKETHDKDLLDKTSFQDLTKEKWWWSKTWQEKLKIFADKYNKLLNETKDYVLDNYSGEWLTWEGREEFLKGLYKKQAALKELENSNEFKNLMLDLAEAWTWNPLDNWSLNWELNETLKLAASWAWSEMFKDKETLNNIVNAARTSWIWKSLDSYIKNWWRASLIGPWAWVIWWLYNMFGWEDAQDIAKEYVNKKGLTRESLMSDEEKENNKWKKFREKNPNVDIKKTTDKMLFWDEAANSWVDNYINTRDDKLATLLKVKWAESPEEIDKFLSQYPSWQNAKQEWKDETLKRLTDKMSNVKYDDFAKQVKDVKAKKETKNKEESKNKEVFDKDSWVWKEDKDWYWNPNNDSPINWVEDSDKSHWDKSDKDSPINEVEQTPENNKYLYINETVKNLGSDKERIDYLKKHWFVVDKKTGFYTKNWMKTKVYKDGKYNPKYVKPDKKEWYNDRTVVEPSKDNDLQIALQESWYQWPRDANGNFLPITDEWLDLHDNLKDKSKK